MEIDYFKYISDVPEYLVNYCRSIYEKYYKDEDSFTFNLYVFDVIDSKVYLYMYRVNKEKGGISACIYIKNKYLVENEWIYSEGKDIYYFYKERLNCINSNKFNLEALEFDGFCIGTYLYVDNLDELKETDLYKYTDIWKCKEFLRNKKRLCLSSLTFCPLYVKQFEYLIKGGLYNLAFYSDYFCGKEIKSLKDIFPDGRYFDYYNKALKDVDIDYWGDIELYIDTFNNIIESFPNLSYDNFFYLIDKYDDFLEIMFEGNLLITLRKSKYNKLFDYCRKLEEIQDIKYLRYLSNANRLGYDINDNKVLCPDSNKIDELDRKMFFDFTYMQDKNLNIHIKEAVNKYSNFNYINDDYKIYAPCTIEELIDESRQMNNCIRTYYEKIINGKSMVFFMRRKEQLDKSYITVEVHLNDGKYKYCALMKNNEEIEDKGIVKILDDWFKGFSIKEGIL